VCLAKLYLNKWSNEPVLQDIAHIANPEVLNVENTSKFVRQVRRRLRMVRQENL
jgi:hypothetical protein